ncbi:MAG TPA: hypothetical protein ENJ19_00290 [Gammaproteobacteria bacterium]|nr:hypothetical protein [Gammaproteobacteria bacterium]
MRLTLALLVCLLLMPVCRAGGGDAMTMSITEVKAKYEKDIMRRPGVVAMGVGRDEAGHPVIVISVEKLSDAVVGSLPHNLEGYVVEVREAGLVRAHQ